MVAVGVASIIMVGMSFFFSGTIKNTFDAQRKITAAQGQFTVNAIINQKLSDIRSVIANGGDNLVALNKPGSKTPFTTIGLDIGPDAEKRLIFKDWFVFNKIIQVGGGHNWYGDPAAGAIKNANDTNFAPVVSQLPSDFAGFIKKDNGVYVVVPRENRVILCDVSGGRTDCSSPTLPSLYGYALNNPIDIAVSDDGNRFFISNAGKGEIVVADKNTTTTTPLVSGLDFPTGLAYDAFGNALYFSETGANLVKRYDFGTGAITVVAGLGEPGSCADGRTARYCDLNMPTGLFLEPTHSNELYIADSGNDRVIKVSDPGVPSAVTLGFKTGADSAILHRISAVFPAGFDLSAVDTDDAGNGQTSLTLTGLNTGGSFTVTGGSLDYLLTTALTQSTDVTNFCSEASCSHDKIEVARPQLFPGGNAIRIPGEAPDFTGGLIGPTVTLNRDMADNYPIGTPVYLMDTVAAGTAVTLEVRNLVVTYVDDRYPLIQIQGYNESGQVTFTAYQAARVGDGALGTEEDIATIMGGGSLRLPTGATNSFIANTGAGTLTDEFGAPQTPLPLSGSGGQSVPDYTSGFTLDSLAFELLSLSGGNVLQMTLTKTVDTDGDPATPAVPQTYKLSAKLP